MISRRILLVLLSFIWLTSCKITNSIRTIRIEIMKPVDSFTPEHVKSIAIFNRDSKSQPGTSYNCGVSNFMGDTTLNKIALSNCCVDGLTRFLEQEEYFQKVNTTQSQLHRLHQGFNLKKG